MVAWPSYVSFFHWQCPFFQAADWKDRAFALSTIFLTQIKIVMKKLINSKLDTFQINRMNPLQMLAVKGGNGDTTDVTDTTNTPDDIVIIDILSE